MKDKFMGKRHINFVRIQLQEYLRVQPWFINIAFVWNAFCATHAKQGHWIQKYFVILSTLYGGERDFYRRQLHSNR